MSESFRALVTSEVDGAFVSSIEVKSTDALVDGEILIAVSYSSLNYKDMLSASGNKGVTRHFPHTPGIDAAGVVIESNEPSLPIGTDVAVIGYDLGMNTPGGFAERIRVPASWVLRLPAGLSQRAAMQYGTAGLTASLCVEALERAGITKEQGDVLVSGASGGVGSFAVALLAARGFRVVASTRKPEADEFLKSLGAAEVVRADAVMSSGGRPMARERWAAAVDTVGESAQVHVDAGDPAAVLEGDVVARPATVVPGTRAARGRGNDALHRAVVDDAQATLHDLHLRRLLTRDATQPGRPAGLIGDAVRIAQLVGGPTAAVGEWGPAQQHHADL